MGKPIFYYLFHICNLSSTYIGYQFDLLLFFCHHHYKRSGKERNEHVCSVLHCEPQVNRETLALIHQKIIFLKK